MLDLRGANDRKKCQQFLRQIGRCRRRAGWLSRVDATTVHAHLRRLDPVILRTVELGFQNLGLSGF